MRSNIGCMGFLALLALAGCDKGGAGGGAGNVSVALTGAPGAAAWIKPPNLVGVAHVYVTLQDLDLHFMSPPADTSGARNDTALDSDDHWISVNLADHTTLDLMTLQGGATAVLGKIVARPAGQITQIRLVLDKQGDHRVMLTDGATCSLDLSQVPATGTRIAHPFAAIDVDDRTPVQLLVDFDVVKSLQVVGACAYRLEPVIEIAGVKRGEVPDDQLEGGAGNSVPPGHQGKRER
jgi:hypothetical protein